MNPSTRISIAHLKLNSIFELHKDDTDKIILLLKEWITNHILNIHKYSSSYINTEPNNSIRLFLDTNLGEIPITIQSITEIKRSLTHYNEIRDLDQYIQFVESNIVGEILYYTISVSEDYQMREFAFFDEINSRVERWL